MTNHDHDPNDLSQTGYPVDEPQQAVDNRTRNLRLALFGIILTAIFFHLIGVGLLVFDSLVAGREVDERRNRDARQSTPIGGDATFVPRQRCARQLPVTPIPPTANAARRDANLIVTPPQFRAAGCGEHEHADSRRSLCRRAARPRPHRHQFRPRRMTTSRRRPKRQR